MVDRIGHAAIAQRTSDKPCARAESCRAAGAKRSPRAARRRCRWRSRASRPLRSLAAKGLGFCRPLAYIDAVEFEWDDAKSDACFAERGFDFAYAMQVFLDPDRRVEADSRFDYGEPRYRVLGQIEGRVFLVVYTPRGEAFRLISARKANAKEVTRYGHSSRDA